jgi:predicted SAM-dependent methyltransferase
MTKLNLGCGEVVLDGYTNCDLYQSNPNIKNVDLNNLPLPFKKDSIDEIILSHVLEHVEKPYDLLIDCDRILKAGGMLKIELPVYNNQIQHRSFFHPTTYLRGLYDYKKKSRDYQIINYDLIKFKKKKRHRNSVIKQSYKRFKEWAYSFLYQNYTWEFKKIK